jgi:hypothetical protein
VDLLQMIQPDYDDDHIIVLLLKEMEEFASVRFYYIENLISSFCSFFLAG